MCGGPACAALRARRLDPVRSRCCRRGLAQKAAPLSALRLTEPAHRAKFTLLFSHANAEDLGLVFDHLKTLSEVLQVNVMGYEYTGYGRATGTPSEVDCYADIAAAFSWLMQEKNLLPSEVILCGRSIGSGPTVELASRAEVGGVILQSAFTSCIRVAYDVKYTAFDAFCNVKKIHKVKCPVLIVHGTRDDVVPCLHGKELYKLCRRPHRPFWVCRCVGLWGCSQGRCGLECHFARCAVLFV